MGHSPSNPPFPQQLLLSQPHPPNPPFPQQQSSNMIHNIELLFPNNPFIFVFPLNYIVNLLYANLGIWFVIK